MIEKKLVEKRIKELETNVEKVNLNIQNSARMRISMQGGIIELKRLLDTKEKIDETKEKKE